jgi:DNA-binding transcriptional regulator YiaG
MMTSEQKSKVAELKAAIATTTKDGAPQEVRAAAVALREELRDSGTTARVLAAALGVHQGTLYRWERDAGMSQTMATPVRTRREHDTGFRMVRLAASATTAASGAPASTAVSMGHGLRVAHAPSGLVIDGLDLDTLVALLRRLS